MDSSQGTQRLSQNAGRLGKAGAAVGVAAAISNLLAYLVPLLGARTLDPDNLGAIAAVMAVLAIAGVPGVGLQMAIAVRVAKHGGVHRLDRLILMGTAATAVPLLLLTPVLSSALRLPWQAVPLTAAIAALFIVGSGWLGLLQGEMRYSRLALGMALLAVARVGGIIIGMLLGARLTGVLMLGVVLALPVVASIHLLLPRMAARQVAPATGLIRDVWAAGSATLVLFLLSYADLIAARHLLPPATSGEYAVLSVLTKGAIWAPQMITIVALPYFAKGAKNVRLIAAAGVLSVGAVLVTASILFGQLALRLAGGQAYVHLAAFAPAFAAVGALYALDFVLTSAQVAGGAKTPSAPLWVALIGFVAAVFTIATPTVEGIVTCAIVAAAGSATALVAVIWLRMRSTPASERDLGTTTPIP